MRAAALIAAGGFFGWSAQEKVVSTWSGVYTAAQAARGEAAYRENCASCHGAKLEGGAQNPPLAGAEFAGKWNGSRLDELFDKIQLSMPADRPGKLSKSTNADIVAYLLKFYQFPEGKTELAPETDSLHGIRFDAEKPK